MPKVNSKKKVSKEDKEKNLKELAENLKSAGVKKSVKPVEVKKNLVAEEDIEDLVSEPFEDFRPTRIPSVSAEAGAPALERIAGEQGGRTFFVAPGAARTPTGTDTDSNGDNGVTYLSSARGDGGPKYSGTSEKIYHEPDRVSFENLGRERETFRNFNQDALFVSSEGNSNGQSGGREKSWRVERFDEESLKKRDNFDKKDIDYKQYKSGA